MTLLIQAILPRYYQVYTFLFAANVFFSADEVKKSHNAIPILPLLVLIIYIPTFLECIVGIPQ